jgi:FtsH-binding integral membrane protein
MALGPYSKHGERNQPINGLTVTRASHVATDVAKRVRVFRRTVRGWMCVGLGVTAAAAYVVAGSPAIMQAIASNQILGVGALIVGLGLVFYLSVRVRKMTDTRGFPREDVRGHGRDVRGARHVRLDRKVEFWSGPGSSSL